MNRNDRFYRMSIALVAFIIVMDFSRYLCEYKQPLSVIFKFYYASEQRDLIVTSQSRKERKKVYLVLLINH